MSNVNQTYEKSKKVSRPESDRAFLCPGKPFHTYPGGKSSPGVPQSLINLIPPHRVFISGFAGNCAVLGQKRPADLDNIAIDLSPAVSQKWAMLEGITSINASFFDVIDGLIEGFTMASLAEMCDTVYGVELASHKSTMWTASQKSAILPAEIFLFLDPPYLLESRSYKKPIYPFEMADMESHKRLIQKINQLSCAGISIMVTHYPNKFYDEGLPCFSHIDVQSRTRKGPVTERVYINYKLNGQLHDYSFIGGNFRERELHNKMKKI